MQRTYSEPHWDAERGAVMAYERVTLYGLPLVPRRRVDYGGVDPEMARELFIRHALVEGDWRRGTTSSATTARCAPSWPSSRSARAAATCSSATTRSTPSTTRASRPTVVSARHFDAWWKKQRHETPDLLTLTRDDLLRRDDDARPTDPDVWQAGDLALPVTYRFEPGADDDGVTVHVPVDVLARLGGDEFAWQVPALREELVTALIRVAAEGPAPQLRSRARHRPRGAGRRSTPGQEPLLDARAARAAPAHRRARAARRLRPRQAARRTCA